MSITVGTRAWASTRHGALTGREQLALAREATVAQITALPGQARVWLTSGRGRGSALVTDRKPPDSRLAREALELAGEASPAPLLGHCLRCWLWADLFAQRDAVEHDPELLYVACLLHDLALTEPHRPGPGARVACFAVHGGQVAHNALGARGAPDAFAERVAEAITLHMNVRVPPALGGEAHLLHAAAHLDVAGTRAADLPLAAQRAVIETHPRDGFPAQFAQLMRHEASERPCSRAALLWRLGMRLPLGHNPLDRS